jgi:hypothetical protein
MLIGRSVSRSGIHQPFAEETDSRASSFAMKVKRGKSGLRGMEWVIFEEGIKG